jgi:endonuclease/exonuclease/phosphatase family metal-dependent hydrolase
VVALDRVWVRPRAALTSVRAHRSDAARAASDHLPVVATIRPVGLEERLSQSG